MPKDNLKENYKSASEWNSLLRWARRERGAYLDLNTLTYQLSNTELPLGSKKYKASEKHIAAIKHQTTIQKEFKAFKANQEEMINKALAAQAELGLNLSSDNDNNTSFGFVSANKGNTYTGVTTGRRGRPRKILD